MARFLFRDAALRYWPKVSGIILLGFLAPILQILLFALLFSIVSAGTSAAVKINFMGYRNRIPMEEQNMVYWAVGLALALGVVAALIFLVKNMAERLSQRYQMFCARRVLSMALSRNDLTLPGEGLSRIRNFIARIVRIDARFIGRSFGKMLFLPVPFLSLVIYFTALWMMEPMLTAMLSLFIPLLILVQLHIIRRSAHISESLESMGSKVSSEIGGLIESRNRSTGVMKDPEVMLDATLMQKSYLKEFIDLRTQLYLLPDRNQLVNDIFSAVIIAVVIATFAWEVGFKVARLTEIVAYLVVLRIVSSNAKTLASTVTQVNRFMPQSRRYVEFVLSNPVKEEKTGDLPPAFRASPGLIATVIDDEVHRYNAPAITAAILEINSATNTRVVPAILSLAACNSDYISLREQLELDDKTEFSSALRAIWPKEKLPPDISKKLENCTCAEAAALLKPGPLLKLMIASAIHRKVSAIYLFEEEIAALPEEELDQILAARKKAFLILVQESPYRRIGSFGEEQFVAVQRETVSSRLSPGEFKEQKREWLSGLRETRSQRRQAEKRGAYSEEEDDLESNEF